MKIIWATRGKTWGYKFLLDGQFADPLPVYERAFSGAEDEPEVFRRIKGGVALRFPDPEGRQDSSGRVIPHEFIILGPSAERARSLEMAAGWFGP